jgi:hypothetical protein
VALRISARRGQQWIADELAVPARTISAILRRHQLPYLRDCDPLTGAVIRASKTTTVRYERSRDGELIHMERQEDWAYSRRWRMEGPRPADGPK